MNLNCRVEDDVLDMYGIVQFFQDADIHFNLRRDFFRQTLDTQFIEAVRHHAAPALHGGSFTDQDDRHVHGHLFSLPHLEEIDVQQFAAYGVPLDFPHEDVFRFFIAFHLKADKTRRPGVRHHFHQLVGAALNRLRFQAMSEEMRRGDSLAAQKAGLLPEHLSFFSFYLEFLHVIPPSNFTI